MKKQILVYFFISSKLFAQQQDSIAIRYSKNITANNLSKDLHIIASDKFEGRETGKKGQKMAAEYIAKQFIAAGIPPYKKNTYYHKFLLNEILPTPAEVSIDGKKYKGNKDYYNYPGETEQRIEADSILFL